VSFPTYVDDVCVEESFAEETARAADVQVAGIQVGPFWFARRADVNGFTPAGLSLPQVKKSRGPKVFEHSLATCSKSQLHARSGSERRTPRWVALDGRFKHLRMLLPLRWRPPEKSQENGRLGKGWAERAERPTLHVQHIKCFGGGYCMTRHHHV
jgi:hypothetical protein